MTADLLLAQMASVTVFAQICGGSGIVGVELAGGEALTASTGAAAVTTTVVVGAPTAVTSSPTLTGRRCRPESEYASSLPRPAFTYCCTLASSCWPVVVQAVVMEEGWRLAAVVVFLRKGNFSIPPRSRRLAVTRQVVGGILQDAGRVAVSL
jgi:hypothetical protein